MNYDVLEESKHSIKNLEDNAWVNHREDYILTKGVTDNFKDTINLEELNIKEATTKEDIDNAQDELTKLINDVEDFSKRFNSSLTKTKNNISLMEIKDDDNDLFNVDKMIDSIKDTKEDKDKDLDVDAIDKLLNNLNAE